MDIGFIVDRMYIELGLSVYAWDVQGRLMHKATLWGKEKQDALESDKNIVEELRKRWEKQEMPVLLVEDEIVFYLAFQDKDQHFYTIGPGANEHLNILQMGAYKKSIIFKFKIILLEHNLFLKL